MRKRHNAAMTPKAAKSAPHTIFRNSLSVFWSIPAVAAAPIVNRLLLPRPTVAILFACPHLLDPIDNSRCLRSPTTSANLSALQPGLNQHLGVR